ncbi:hypothetical protein CMQ_585 [Grosmannia clavigera kw1407]|uniref:BTB domain-containing protein n=1 Tax=Grosmannia clavigera (strain kw1407 / UAMH 11150) TaxID=655863 RepID=F0XDC5_GROCL|nr:uncharacterized protein CMQ_585 [Grosmannia clavigera kw1407]EFX03657.1 hypothetical protein CMQ_585 [Grosmannia clavigera kw1407]
MADHCPGDLVRVRVGPDQREFVVHRRLLCASSVLFRDSLAAVPEGLASSAASLSSCPASVSRPRTTSSAIVLWLAAESAGMFELFVLWLYRGHAFRAAIDDMAGASAEEEVRLRTPPGLASPSPSLGAAPSRSDLHWHLVYAHLFGARADIPALQDAAMDALQDLYLRLDWEATPQLIGFLYGDCDDDPVAACRLRKWAVALLAWTLANLSSRGDAEDAAALGRLLVTFPALRADYDAHIDKMAASAADVRIKNPQLRIPSNHLRRDDRHFGFRQCSFHSHRRSVGQGRCPHSPGLRQVAQAQSPQAQAAQTQTSQASQASQSSQSSPQQQHHQHHHHHHRHHHSSSSKHSRLEQTTAVPSPTPSFSSRSHSASLSSSTGTSPFSRSSHTSSRSSATSDPRLADLSIWPSPPVTTPRLAPLGMESTI